MSSNGLNKEERIGAARSYHKRGCNCCQAVVMAYADLLPVSDEVALLMAKPFGRGLAGEREVCGCVSGMALVCGLVGEDPQLHDLIGQFRSENGDIVCGRLLQSGKRPCTELVACAAGLLASALPGQPSAI
ncbi:MAG: C_GCAxxG_C_C family protein [Bacteroidales bacterium]|nr:C_GCAxxG_C_C family protein [Bacteroidales bacterium]